MVGPISNGNYGISNGNYGISSGNHGISYGNYGISNGNYNISNVCIIPSRITPQRMDNEGTTYIDILQTKRNIILNIYFV